MCKKTELLIIGKKPGPIGGVTIHVSRLLSLLSKVGISYDFYDLSRFCVVGFINAIKLTEYAHLHSSSPLFSELARMSAFIKVLYNGSSS